MTAHRARGVSGLAQSSPAGFNGPHHPGDPGGSGTGKPRQRTIPRTPAPPHPRTLGYPGRVGAWPGIAAHAARDCRETGRSSDAKHSQQPTINAKASPPPRRHPPVPPRGGPARSAPTAAGTQQHATGTRPTSITSSPVTTIHLLLSRPSASPATGPRPPGRGRSRPHVWPPCGVARPSRTHARPHATRERDANHLKQSKQTNAMKRRNLRETFEAKTAKTQRKPPGPDSPHPPS